MSARRRKAKARTRRKVQPQLPTYNPGEEHYNLRTMAEILRVISVNTEALDDWQMIVGHVADQLQIIAERLVGKAVAA